MQNIDEVPAVITRPWLEKWIEKWYPHLRLHEKDGQRGYYDVADGVESFVGHGKTWQRVYEFLDENKVEP
jgi:hypothetical protein